MDDLTATEAETLAHMLDSAGRKMARVQHRIPGTDNYGYVWADASTPFAEMLAAFYDLVPFERGIFV